MDRIKIMEAMDIIPEKVMDFCKLKFGEGKHPKIHFIFDKRYKKRFAEYRIGTIVLFANNIPTIKSLVGSIIHEYVHHLQLNHWKKMENYFTLLNEFGYEDHPQEKEAVDITKYYTKECVEYLKSLGYLK